MAAQWAACSIRPNPHEVTKNPFFLEPYRVSKVSGIPYEEIESIYKDIKEKHRTEFDDVFAQKRQEIAEDRRIYVNRDKATKVASAKEQIPDGHAGIGKIHGKLFSKKLKEK
ncbi:hypothetical protein [Halomonas mongoliensis]|uniref:hypothetical protein n=1 Tax=Halomonas mongoliensis TaxID=321265 RepID=UPI00403B1F6E